ncbi:MAG TPA: XVIPCD domain-containing protein [Luteibacter sp.]|uniref:XVIPCD domain-containing protein n=1 Tax=Luteibacter sp. TaxID=1886636 RepID=UPI002CF04083|nr:XVIPCD domain-containing protein [Luteibacter sp.]HVI55555.1 XVIPCD domain-containing protein [Luteibacter sp.]
MAIDRETQVLTDATAAGMTNPRELANFMAQVTHESNGLNRLEESFRYTRNISQIPVQAAWREGPEVLEAARKQALMGKPEQLAELMYGGRNGNDEPGDGWKYHGRGYIQLTGKDNYRAAGEALDLDLVKHPELAADPQNASKIAVWYWENRVPENARDDVRAATRAVNGKYNGLEDRENRFADWQHRLTPDVMHRLAEGNVGRPQREHPTLDAGKAPAPLKEGANGEDVRLLQGNLARLGYTAGNHGELHTDGKFGPGTRAAVQAFQRDHHLPVDGVAGPRTMEAIAQAEHQDATRRAAQSGRLDSSAHPDNALYEQARDAVHNLDAQYRRTPDKQSDQLAGAVTVEARRQGLTRIDHVILSDDGSRAFAVQGDLKSPLKRTAEVDTAKAVNTPIEQSGAEIAALAPASPAPVEEARRQAPETGPPPPMPDGPVHGR